MIRRVSLAASPARSAGVMFLVALAAYVWLQPTAATAPPEAAEAVPAADTDYSADKAYLEELKRRGGMTIGVNPLIDDAEKGSRRYIDR